MARSLTQKLAQKEAELCVAFVDPTRILVLYALDEKPCHVGELADLLDVSQPTVSHHLKVLRNLGLVNNVRHGKAVEYHLADPRLIQGLDIFQAVTCDWIHRRTHLTDEEDGG